ncbi:immunogenic protein MPB64/MPT64 [Mycobacterium lentiflavum]|uniref:Immunogenic protein MPB64/MPT64 n=2 Tax=Mycobacterium lentiflavum TaxID=141349 RepID=A0A0E4CP88_MYCLN|nr:immunogenic protein MPB64/MPT64 [Mycobacterium lentiflavum]
MAMSYRGALNAVVAATVIASAAGCDTSHGPQQTTSTASSATATTSVVVQGQSACSELHGTIGADRSCHVHGATSDYTIEMSFPVDYPDMSPVTDFLKRNRDEFLDWVAKFGPSDRRGRPYEYRVTAMTFRSGPAHSGTQSLVLKIDNDTGFAHEGHPNTTFRSFNFDVGRRVPITFDTLFKPGTKPLEVLNPIVARQFNAPTADLDDTTYQNFAMTNEAVIFFFGQDQVVQDNAGPHKITVPRSELAPLLA